MIETERRKMKREIAELQKELAQAYRNIDELRKDGRVQAQKEYAMRVVEENADLKRGARQLQASVDAILREVILRFGKDRAIRIPKPNVDENFKWMIEGQVVGDAMFLKLKSIAEPLDEKKS